MCVIRHGGSQLRRMEGKGSVGWLDSVRHRTRRGFGGGRPAKSSIVPQISDRSLRSSLNLTNMGRNLKFTGDGTLNRFDMNSDPEQNPSGPGKLNEETKNRLRRSEGERRASPWFPPSLIDPTVARYANPSADPEEKSETSSLTRRRAHFA